MKVCQLCGETVGVDVQTCPEDGEASWGPSLLEVVPALEEVTPKKRGPGRPKKVQS